MKILNSWCACSDLYAHTEQWAYGSGIDVHPDHTHQFVTCMHSMHISFPIFQISFYIPSACAPETDANAELICMERMRALSLRDRNWCVQWACTSGTNACTEHSPFKTCWAYMHQELMHTLNIQSGTDVPWAFTSGTGSCPEHTHHFLRHVLSISVKITKFEKILSKILRMRGRNWCMHWTCVSGTDACTERKRQELMCKLNMQYPNIGS